jgi:hypothetical protein
MALALLLIATTTIFAGNALMGTWKLNEGKSKFAPGATKNTMVTYAPAKGDMIKCTVDGVDKAGKPIHWDWVGKFDGKPYPLKRSPSFEMLTYKPVNDRTNKTTATKAGKPGNDGHDHPVERWEVARSQAHGDGCERAEVH